jgi:peroxiredoxin
VAALERIRLLRILAGLLPLLLILAGCVGKWTPEQSAALTATAVSYLVPTRTPAPTSPASPSPQSTATKSPASQPSETTTPAPAPGSPQATAPESRTPLPSETDTPAPVAASPQASPQTNLATGTQVGQAPPDFVLDDAQGQPVSLASFHGRPVLLIFWASWCTHCQKTMPLIETLYEQYSDQGFEAIGVSVPGLSGETKESALAYVQQKGITFPIVFDEEASTYREYQVVGVPTLIFVDRNGVIISNHPGEMDLQSLQAQIQQLVGQG